jgi:hypothetical protein
LAKNLTGQWKFQGFSAAGQTYADHCGHGFQDRMEECA